MQLAPVKWSGSARQLIDELLKPHFISVEKARAWHQFLEKKLADAETIFVVQAHQPEQRFRWGQDRPHLTHSGTKVYFGDSSPAATAVTYLLETTGQTAEKMAALYLHLPHHMFDLDKFSRWAGLTNNVASAGWSVQHIYKGVSAGPNWESLSLKELRRMTVRNLHVLNLYLFPNLKKSGALFADDPRFRALMTEAYRKFYGPLWDSFHALAEIDDASQPAAEDFQIDLSGGEPPSDKLRAAESKELISRIEPKDAFDLKLITISEAQGYQSRLLDPGTLSRGSIDLKLDFKEKGGQTKTVGYYRLKLKDLYEKKFLPRDNQGVKLMIYRTDADQYAVAPKKVGPFSPLPL